jgi:AcrR family transcriptional regulator
MNDAVLSPERIVDAAEDVLRRYGPAKATVVDVARALGVSHGSVYRHFASKAALRDAVVARWLHRFSDPLAKIADENGPAPERLRRWMDTLIATKRRKMVAESEMFETYHELFTEARDVVGAHVEELSGQLGRIVADGVRRGEFAVADPSARGRAIFDATGRFHNPVHAAEWQQPGIDEAFEDVWALLMAGLGTGARNA